MKKLVYGIGMILLLCMTACSKDDSGSNNYVPNALIGRWYLYGCDTIYYTPGLYEIVKTSKHYIEEKDRDYSLWEFEFYDNKTMKHRTTKAMPFTLSNDTIKSDYWLYKIDKLNNDSMVLRYFGRPTEIDGYIPDIKNYFIKIKK